MTKLCIGVFEKRGWPNTTQPIFWVNAHIFDYRGILLTRDTLHMWNYSLGDIMPTHETNLSPLRHTVSNPEREDTPNLILQLCGLETPTFNEKELQARQSLTSDVTCEKASIKTQRIKFKEFSAGSASEVLEDNTLSFGQSISKAALDKSKFDNVISKLYDQELKVIANRDPLHDITEQVIPGNFRILNTYYGWNLLNNYFRANVIKFNNLMKILFFRKRI